MPPLPVSSDDAEIAMPDEVLTIKEVAALLKLADKTVYAMAQAGEIPAFKIRGQWRIKRAELDQWIDAQPRGGESGGGNDNGR
jgi:excisionase family DNA binding protein